MKKVKYALISVYNKNNIQIICKFFKINNIQIISSGSTAKYIKKIGYKSFTINQLTKFKEMLDGRVKTLHPYIHASILYERQNKKHTKEFNKLKFPSIDFVIVNLYPFEKIVKNNPKEKDCIEMIDIGGSALLRAAAKNYKSVTAICDPLDYKNLINNMKKHSGVTNISFRKKMASKVFNLSASYDRMVSDWMHKKISHENKFINHREKKLRYGENPHQKSSFFKNFSESGLVDGCFQNYERLSYNNLLDAESAYNCINDFKEPTCAIIKHTNPCGVASDKKIIQSFLKAYDSDPSSAFGGIVAINKKLEENLAKLIINKFFEIIIAPSFTEKAKLILKKKNNLILFETNKLKYNNLTELKSISGGYLVQQNNNVIFSKKYMKCATIKKSLPKEINDLIFSFKVCKHVKSNAIVLVKNKQTIGIGAGQMSRIQSTKISISKIKKKNNSGFVAASDAFFPFIDNVQLLKKNNCKAIIQPSGSANDKKIVEFANKNNLALYFSKYRFFKH